MERYYELAMDGVGIVGFVKRAAAGEWGPATPAVLHRFLDDLEVLILGNIETRLEEAPGREGDAEEAAEATRVELAEARGLIPDA